MSEEVLIKNKRYSVAQIMGILKQAEIRRSRASRMPVCSIWQWHLDEVFVKINGETHYLWRDVDHEGEVLEREVVLHFRQLQPV